SSATVGLQHGSSSTQFECNSGGLTTGLQLSFQRQPCTEGNGPCFEPPPLLWHGTPGGLVLEFQTVSTHTYYLEYTDSLDAPTWRVLQSLAGDDTVKGVTVSTLEQAQRFFRLRVQ